MVISFAYIMDKESQCNIEVWNKQISEKKVTRRGLVGPRRGDITGG
jgi:hypothetical protein